MEKTTKQTVSSFNCEGTNDILDYLRDMGHGRMSAFIRAAIQEKWSREGDEIKKEVRKKFKQRTEN